MIDGKAQAAALRARVADGARQFDERAGRPAGLAVILVGEDPASGIYVRNKGRATREAGMRSFEHRLPADLRQADLLALVERLNADPAVDGILVQLPLPPQVDEATVLAAIDPAKDVDGFHALNTGRLWSGQPALVPCTPLGCLQLIKSARAVLSGLNALVIGRSNIVGKPVAALLLGEDCTVTIAHSRTRDLAATARSADILVAAVGRPALVRAHWVKPGATVIDVGINRVDGPDGKARLVGDVAFAECAEVAGAITPVPGGVGPMTIANLLANTLRAAHARGGFPAPGML